MLGRYVTRAPRRILAGSVLLFLLAGVLAATVIEALALNRYEAPGSESLRARAALAEQFGTSTSNVALLVTATDGGSVDDADVAAAGAALTDRLAAEPGVGDAWSYWSDGAATLRSEDGRHALVLAWVPGDADHVRGDVLPALTERFAGTDGPVEVAIGGGDEVFRVVAEQARADFLRAEIVILPLVGALLWLVYRRLGPALVTLGIGLFSVVGTLAILRVVTLFTEVSTFASNIALVMGIGLGVDYGLFVTYRFREELARGLPVPDAVRVAVAGAGRTVLFSGATVAASLAVLFVFPFPFLSSFAYAGIAVVLTAVVGATVILPAALMLLGHRAARRAGRGRAERETGFWFRVSTAVMRRPVVSGAAALVVLLGLGAPAAGVDFGSPDDRVLPAGQPVRDLYDTVRAEFATEDADAVQVVAPSLPDAEIAPYAAALSELDGVERVDSAAGAFAGGARIAAAADPGRYADGTGAWFAVV
ncbi:MMPL family transporter, partial [Jiangella rhizosphaerae]